MKTGFVTNGVADACFTADCRKKVKVALLLKEHEVRFSETN